MDKLSQNQKQWLAWGLIAVILTGLSVGLGVQFPVPAPPPFATEEIVTLGTTHFTNVTAEDITTTDDLVVGDDAAVSGDATITGALTAADLILTSQTAISVTDGAVFTPTGTYQPIESAAEVTPTISTSGYTAGEVLTLINTTDTTINLADASTLMLSAAGALGQYDTLTLWFDGTNWLEVSRSNN